MPNPSDTPAAGRSYLFTAVPVHQAAGVDLAAHIDVVRRAMAEARCRRPFIVAACLVFPDHLRGLWMLPAGDDGFIARWRIIEGVLQPCLLPSIRAAARAYPRGGQITESLRICWREIPTWGELAAHLDRLHSAPEGGYAEQAADWACLGLRSAGRNGRSQREKAA